MAKRYYVLTTITLEARETFDVRAETEEQAHARALAIARAKLERDACDLGCQLGWEVNITRDHEEGDRLFATEAYAETEDVTEDD